MILLQVLYTFLGIFFFTLFIAQTVLGEAIVSALLLMLLPKQTELIYFLHMYPNSFCQDFVLFAVLD